MAQTNTARRVYEIELIDRDGDGRMFLDSDRVNGWMQRMAAVLIEVGGTLTIQSERVEVDRLGTEPIAVTSRLIARWNSTTTLVRQPDPEPVVEQEILEPDFDPDVELEG